MKKTTIVASAFITAALMLASALPVHAAENSVSYLAPAFQDGELTGDAKVDRDDLTALLTSARQAPAPA